MSLRSIVIVTAVLAGAPALACDPPDAPWSMPDGKTADKQTMLAKKKEVDNYRRAVEQYLGCERNQIRMQTAQSELDRVANRFNAEVRAFKAANGG